MTRFLARGTSIWRDLPLVLWFVAAIVLSVIHRWVPDADWLMLHLVVLGAASHAILVWSYHFAQTVLRSPGDEAGHRRQVVRLVLLAVGTAVVLVGVPTTWWPVTLVGALAVGGAVAWHGVELWRMLRGALPARFTITVHYYLAAVGFLLLGITLGVITAWGWDDTWHGRLLVGHALANVLGWIGLTVTGTLLTLWPTMLRTRMDDRAVLWTRRALPLFAAAVTVTVAGALAGIGWLAALGLVGYLASFALWGRGLWQPARSRPPREFAPLSVGVSLIWLVIGLGWAGWLLVTSPDWAAVREGFVWPAATLVAGCVVQLVTGALSYLLPSVIGGGPSVVRAGQAWFNKAGGFRLIVINGGLALWLLPTPSWVKVTGSLLALVGAAMFLPLMAGGLRASLRARREAETGSPAGPDRPTGIPAMTGSEAAPDRPAVIPAKAGISPSEIPASAGMTKGAGSLAAGPAPIPRPGPVETPSVLTAGQLIAGLTALATAVVFGVGIDPAAAGVGTSTSTSTSSVTPTGNVVRVRVEAVGMRYEPASVHLARGDQLIIELVNADTTTHDLVIGDARTSRLAPGATEELDAGVIGESVLGFCSVVGHRQMGMVFEVIVDDAPAAEPSSQPTGHEGHEPSGETPALSSVIDPVLPPLTDEKVHELTLTVQEVPLEVAPGVWQRRWTFNGTAPGPVLHGRVGDVFEITLVNDGTIGHSIDFHAGSLAPDGPMRTIEPGESLVYRFTATMAGIWMYHCSTMPMSAHIAAGMHGAVIIEPDGLPPVDRTYALVQSEVYLDTAASDPQSATEVNADKVNAEQPDYVVFNGIANAYDQEQFAAKVGERVRFWVLDAGPNRLSSFHIVGSQFDTVYAEGSYLLKRGQDAFGTQHGGSQVLGLLPAQGGFVEAVFPEAGHYPVVSHLMVDAERGAHGFVNVTE
ncbi:MAG: multicopper oxidase domain-containing protein [Propionibacteriaceae bacterium]|nr:multicopper oxidase domain-containing protein [Propionibacteriaceae bacterium]